jgi:hypothetical protein
MLKFVGFITIVGLAFAAGVYVGRQGPEVLLKKVQQIGGLLAARTTSLERDVTVQLSLVNAKERLIQAKSNLLDKNYGKAQADLGDAMQNLSRAKAAADDDLRAKLEGLLAKVSEVMAEAKAAKPGVPANLEKVVTELNTLLAR